MKADSPLLVKKISQYLQREWW